MLGGRNIYKLQGTREVWYILSGSTIEHSTYIFEEKGYTLEQFLEQFPYKVGDKVKNSRINDFIGRIVNVRWDNNEKQIIYTVEWDDATKTTLNYFASGLQPYKETRTQIDLTKGLPADEIEVILGDYEFRFKDNKLYFARKQS